MESIKLFKITTPTYLQLAQLLLFCSFLFSQFQLVPKTSVEQYPIPQAIAASDLRVLSIGEPAIVAKMLGYWLLSYDTQSGNIIPYEKLDYQRLTAWLDTIQQLDSLSDYPTMVAAGVFIEVKDRQRQLLMIEFVRKQFLKNPERHWRWMAQVIMLSKYRLKDMPLALSLASDLRLASAGIEIPHWAREMEVYLLHDMGELEAALLLIRAMIDEGVITDADELRFLNQRILQLEATLESN